MDIDNKAVIENKAPDKIWNVMFISIFFANMVMNLGQFMANSLLSVYADSLGATPAAIGLLMSAFAVTAIMFRFISAPAMDTYNRKHIVIFAMLTLAVAFFGFSMSRSIEALVVFRLLQGCGMAFGNACCLAMVSEALPKEGYGTGMGYYSLAQVVSQAMGPTVGLWLSRLVGFQATYGIITGLLLLGTVLAFQIKTNFKRTNKFKISLGGAVAKEALLPGVVMLFLLATFSVTGSFLIVYAGKQGVSEHIGLYFIVSSVTMVLTRPVIGKLTDKYGIVKIFIPAIVCDLLVFTLISFSRSLIMFLTAAFISAFGFGAMMPAIQALSMKCVPNERRGAASSTNYLGMDIGAFTGPLIAGGIAERFGYVSMWRIMIFPLLIALLLMLLYRKKITAIEENFMA